MTRASASGRCESARGCMDDAESTADHDETVIPLLGQPTTRRGVLTGGAAAIGAMLSSALYADAQSDPPTVGGDRTILGDTYRVADHGLTMPGTLRELFVGVRHDDFPAPNSTPSLRYAWEGGPRLYPGTGNEQSVKWLRTNIASVEIAGAYMNTGGTDTPALRLAPDGTSIGLVLDGAASQRSAVGGSCQEINAGPALADLPSSPPEPAFQVAVDGGERVFV